MRIFLTGVSCVGKTTVGAKLATLLSRPFFDLDYEIESFFSMPIERLQGKCLTMYAFRQEAAKALTHLLKREESGEAVIALPPSGLMDNYWRVVKRAKGTIVVLTDDAANILKRITFYDKDSNPIAKHVTEKEKPLYLKEIEKAITYFNFGRLAYPMHRKVTTGVLLGRKRHGCLVCLHGGGSDLGGSKPRGLNMSE
jgi:shikimate kinase